MNVKSSGKWGVLSSLLLLFLIPAPASANPVIVQTAGNQNFATPGTFGFSKVADLSVLITTHGGEPVSTLGPAVIGDGSALISLPAGWTFTGNFTRPPMACALAPTQFFNTGGGRYVIRVISAPPDCPWVVGDYHYVVQIDIPATRSSSGLQGSGLGVLPIR